MICHRHWFVIQNSLFYHKIKSNQWNQPSLQFVLPIKFRKQALHACHDDVGHLGLERSLDLLKD